MGLNYASGLRDMRLSGPTLRAICSFPTPKINAIGVIALVAHGRVVPTKIMATTHEVSVMVARTVSVAKVVMTAVVVMTATGAMTAQVLTQLSVTTKTTKSQTSVSRVVWPLKCRPMMGARVWSLAEIMSMRHLSNGKSAPKRKRRLQSAKLKRPRVRLSMNRSFQ